MPNDDQVELFDKTHGIGAFDRCMSAAWKASRFRRIAGAEDVTVYYLERNGIATPLARAFCDLLRPPAEARPPIRRGAVRKSDRIVRRSAG